MRSDLCLNATRVMDCAARSITVLSQIFEVAAVSAILETQTSVVNR